MTDPHKSDQPADEDGTGQNRALTGHHEPAGSGDAQASPDTDPVDDAHPAGDAGPTDATRPAEGTNPVGEADPTEDAHPTENADPAGDADPTEGAHPTEGTHPMGAHPADGGPTRQKGGRTLWAGIGGAVLAGAAAAFLVTGFLAPGFLVKPGTPDAAAAQATAALAGKNVQELERVSCQGPDGRPIAPVPAEALELIQTATQAGPLRLALDTQAQAPLDLTVTAQDGRTQTLPAEMQFAVTGGEWCLSGIAQRQ